MMQQFPTTNTNSQAGTRQQYIAQQQTLPQPATFHATFGHTIPTGNLPYAQLPEPVLPLDAPEPSMPSKKKLIARVIAVFLTLGFAGAMYVIWNTATPTPVQTTGSSSSVGQQNLSASGATTSTTDGIQVYVVGAVKHPGVYTLPSGARVYDLLQAAGGALPQANLVGVNLAAKLSDGQEVYITQVGETPPTSTGGVSGTGVGTSGSTNGQLVNINTANIDELTLNLHISKKSAQAIIDYKTQHGNYSSVDQLAQVVSRTIYNKIKALCTI